MPLNSKFLLIVLTMLSSVIAFRPTAFSRGIGRGIDLQMGTGKEAKRAWAKGDLGKDIFDEDNADIADVKKKFKLEPESVFFEGPPSITEVIFPALSIFTVIGIIPFVAAAARQVWVRYKISSRRISIQSGIGGKDQAEIIYPDIEQMKYVFRAFGGSGDMVLFLKDGAKVELRHVPKFEEVYEYIFGKCDAEAQSKSMKITPKPAVNGA